MISSPLAGSRMRGHLAVLAAGTLALAGCSTSMTPSTGSSIVSSNAMVTGKVHGGNQPVSGATVTLYRAGQNGFATGGTAIAHTTSSSDGFGAFTFSKNAASASNNSDNTFSCLVNGTDTNAYLYLVARGGTTVNSAGAAANPKAVFIAPLGACDSVSASTSIYMSEVVTVATIAAIHQFMDPSTSPIETTIGADGVFVSSTALSNAFNGVSNMVSLATGLGNQPFTKTGSSVNGSVGVVVTITPELAKINQLANAISSCINYSGSGNPSCDTIFNNATQPAGAGSTSVPGATYSTTTDLLTALYFLFTNPTSGGASARQNIFELSTAAGAPYQPTLSATPSDWSIGVAFQSTSNCTDVTGSTAGFINNPYSLDIDRFGDVWIGNNQSGAGSLGHLQADGQPSSCTTLTPHGSNGATDSARSTTVDTNGNIYSGLVQSNDLYRFTPSTSSPSTPIDIPTPEPIQALAADGSGNIFYATTAGNLYEIANAASTTSYSAASSVQINTASLGSPTRMIIDAAGRIWASSGGMFVTFTQLNSGGTAYVTTNVPTSSLVTDITVGVASAGNTQIYTVNPGSNAVQNLTITSANVVTQNADFTGAGLADPAALALDGSANTWLANNTANSVSGITASGDSLTSTTGLQKSGTYFSGSHGITVDSAGNLWVATGTSTITEIVGAAVPVYKSYAIALHTNRFQTIP